MFNTHRRLRSLTAAAFIAAGLPAASVSARPAPPGRPEMPGARPSSGHDRLASMLANKVRDTLEWAKTSAKAAAEATVYKYRLNNYRIARDRLRDATKKITELEETMGPSHEQVVALRQEWSATNAEVLQVTAEIRAVVLADEQPPVDVYKGKDKSRLASMVSAAWKKEYPADQVLGLRFHAAGWQTTKNRRWNDAVRTWQYTDVSALAVSVLVKADDKSADVFVAFVNKDNKDGSLNVGVHTKFGDTVVREVLLSKIK